MTAVWYLMRATGVTSLVLQTLVLVLGIATIKRWRVRRAPAFVTAAAHRSISILSVVFLAIHVVTALIDPYAAVSVSAVVVPFSGTTEPLWLGLGALSLDLVAAVVVSSLLMRHIGMRAWRAIHWLSYLCWPLALAHTLGEGSDAASPWLEWLSAACVLAVGASLAWRLASRSTGKRLERRPSGARVGAAA